MGPFINKCNLSTCMPITFSSTMRLGNALQGPSSSRWYVSIGQDGQLPLFLAFRVFLLGSDPM